MVARASKEPSPRIVLLGWGSLIWDKRFPDFDKHHQAWQPDGPNLMLEFSRVSGSRDGALTLVIDPEHGAACRVAYADSTRRSLEDTICDLRCREGTTWRNTGFILADGSREHGRDDATRDAIREWSETKGIHAVVWTDLRSNFAKERGAPFSIEAALRHIESLKPAAKAKAAEYVSLAPDFVATPLRAALQAAPWFAQQPNSSQ